MKNNKKYTSTDFNSSSNFKCNISDFLLFILINSSFSFCDFLIIPCASVFNLLKYNNEVCLTDSITSLNTLYGKILYFVFKLIFWFNKFD